MKFERGQNVKDAVKIGRYANAIGIDHLDVIGKIPGKWQKSVEEEFKSLDPSKMHSFGIAGEALLWILHEMEKSGISKKLDNKIKELIVKRHIKVVDDAVKHNGHPGSVDYDLDDSYIKSILFHRNDVDSIYPYDKIISLPDTLGKDLLYDGKLYRIKNEF